MTWAVNRQSSCTLCNKSRANAVLNLKSSSLRQQTISLLWVQRDGYDCPGEHNPSPWSDARHDKPNNLDIS